MENLDLVDGLLSLPTVKYTYAEKTRKLDEMVPKVKNEEIADLGTQLNVPMSERNVPVRTSGLTLTPRPPGVTL